MQINSFLLVIMALLFSSGCPGQHDHSHSGQDARPVEKDQERSMWQLPGRVIREIGVAEGMAVADVGAGEGYFTILLAQKVGATGLVYASDIDGRALSVLKMKSEKIGLKNIRIVTGTEDNPKLPAGQFDIVLIVNTIHLIHDLNSVLDHVKSSLKQNGRLVIIQWDAEKMAVESPLEWDETDKARYTLQTTLRRIYAANFEVERILTFLPVQNIFICIPKTM